MEIIALQDYTDKYVSLYEGEVRNIGKNLANKLIAKGIVAEHDETESGSGSGSSSGGAYVVTVTSEYDETEDSYTYSIDKTFSDIVTAYNNGQIILFKRTEYQGNSSLDYYLTQLNNGGDGYGYIIAISMNFSGGSWFFSVKGGRFSFEDNTLISAYFD